jgi:hypothetical protein
LCDDVFSRLGSGKPNGWGYAVRKTECQRVSIFCRNEHACEGIDRAY